MEEFKNELKILLKDTKYKFHLPLGDTYCFMDENFNIFIGCSISHYYAGSWYEWGNHNISVYHTLMKNINIILEKYDMKIINTKEIIGKSIGRFGIISENEILKNEDIIENLN